MIWLLNVFLMEFQKLRGNPISAREIGGNFRCARCETVRLRRRICCGTCSFQKVIPRQCLGVCAKRWALRSDGVLVILLGCESSMSWKTCLTCFWYHFSQWLRILGGGFIHLLQGLGFARCGCWLSKADCTLAPDLWRSCERRKQTHNTLWDEKH